MNQMEHLHKVLLIIMDEVNRICKKNNIDYTLIGGSLLGAIRHRGFIPWDDDLDIAMTRENYDKFVSACNNELDDRFDIVTINNQENYGYGFGKVILKNTSVIPRHKKKFEEIKEIWIDIFPYDNIPNSRLLRLVHKYKNYIYIKLIEERLDGIDNEQATKLKILCYRIMNIINKIIKLDKLKKSLLTNQTKYDSIETDYICSLSGSYKYNKETQKKDFFESYEWIVFEDRKYQVVSCYDKYLKSVYGDYMKIPNENNRGTHEFLKINFGPYETI